ncbi:MAG: flagellar basal body P-ring protein FlgI, partial [Gammaproteobacteria bacterium]|nr:flagellar basal body P-ring protein FlgI [Gammaproteobacteria bacterium]
PSSFATLPAVFLNLHTPDFTTANRLCEAVNAKLGAGTAQPIDPTSIKIAAPVDSAQRISFVSVLENIELQPAAAAAKVIVNSRTGTVVIGTHVRVSPAAVSHGSLTVTITESPGVSQPNGFSRGETVVVDRSDIEINQEAQRMFLFEPGVTLNEIVTAVNQVGAAPGDLVAILEALKQAGSLHAELIVI